MYSTRFLRSQPSAFSHTPRFGWLLGTFILQLNAFTHLYFSWSFSAPLSSSLATTIHPAWLHRRGAALWIVKDLCCINFSDSWCLFSYCLRMSVVSLGMSDDTAVYLHPDFSYHLFTSGFSTKTLHRFRISHQLRRALLHRLRISISFNISYVSAQYIFSSFSIYHFCFSYVRHRLLPGGHIFHLLHICWVDSRIRWRVLFISV